jgi:hypothetical protein
MWNIPKDLIARMQTNKKNAANHKIYFHFREEKGKVAVDHEYRLN